jgi:scyllo-inositol 2-dehydrogenase (NAD+)
MGTINLAVIGLGRMGRIYSNHILRHLGNARLAAVASTSPGARDKLPSVGAQVAVYTDFRDLLADPLLNCPQLAGVGDIDNAIVTLHFARGCLGLVEACRNARYGYDIRCEIRGSEDTLQIGYLRDTPVTALTRTGGCHDIVPWFEERFTPAYGAQIDHFIDCIQRDQPPAVGLADARTALQVSLAATRSQQQRRPVNVADISA